MGPEDAHGYSVTPVDQSNEPTIVSPVDEVQLTHLSVEGVVGDVQLARRHKLTTWNPLDRSVVVDPRTELPIRLVVV